MKSVSHSLHKDLQNQNCWGLVLLAEYQGWDTWCGAQNLSYLVRFSAIVIILFLLVTYQGMWALNVYCLHPSYPSCCGIFFISIIVENISNLSSGYFHRYLLDSCNFGVPMEKVSSGPFLCPLCHFMISFLIGHDLFLSPCLFMSW